jgi:hypothetical protein
LDKIDFSKPERYLKEIYDFISEVTILNLSDLIKKKNTLNQKDAQMLFFNLIVISAPNFVNEPAWNPTDITYLLQVLDCPYPIRSDAITAVGAATSIGFLVRILYWLHLVGKNFYLRDEEVSVIPEDSLEHDASQSEHNPPFANFSGPIREVQIDNLFSQLLLHVASMFPCPSQLEFTLPYQVELMELETLNKLICFEF